MKEFAKMYFVGTQIRDQELQGLSHLVITKLSELIALYTKALKNRMAKYLLSHCHLKVKHTVQVWNSKFYLLT